MRVQEESAYAIISLILRKMLSSLQLHVSSVETELLCHSPGLGHTKSGSDRDNRCQCGRRGENAEVHTPRDVFESTWSPILAIGASP